MKTVRVISEFLDKFNPARLYKVGEVVQFADERAADMVARKLAVLVEEPKKAEPEPEVKAEAKAEVKNEAKPKPAIAKPLKKGTKDEADGNKKQGK